MVSCPSVGETWSRLAGLGLIVLGCRSRQPRGVLSTWSRLAYTIILIPLKAPTLFGAGLPTPPECPTLFGAGLPTPPQCPTMFGAGLPTPPECLTGGLLRVLTSPAEGCSSRLHALASKAFVPPAHTPREGDLRSGARGGVRRPAPNKLARRSLLLEGRNVNDASSFTSVDSPSPARHAPDLGIGMGRRSTAWSLVCF
jgi:hypothetical protein